MFSFLRDCTDDYFRSTHFNLEDVRELDRGIAGKNEEEKEDLKTLEENFRKTREIYQEKMDQLNKRDEDYSSNNGENKSG